MARPRYPRPMPLANNNGRRRGGLGPVSVSANIPGQSKPQGFAKPPAPASPSLISPNVGASIQPPKLAPVDPAFDQQKASIETNKTNTIAGLQGERTRYMQDSGYNARYDANGNLIAGSLQFDPTNVFSRAALLLKKYRESRVGNTNTLASMGQLNSGAYGRQQTAINFGESQAQDAQQKGIMDFLARNQGQIAKAGTDAEFAIGQAEGERLQRAPDNPLYDPTTPGGPIAASDPKTTPQMRYDAFGRLITARSGVEARIVPGKNSKGESGYWHYYPDGRTVFVKKK